MVHETHSQTDRPRGTYGQSSRVTTAMLELDANNRFFLRGPRFRMTAEMIVIMACKLPDY